MTDLSPAAQVIHDAYWNEPDDGYENTSLAACLRAVADQICMKQSLGDTDADAGVFAAHHAINISLLAIADELDGYPNEKLTGEELEELELGISSLFDSFSLKNPGQCFFHT